MPKVTDEILFSAARHAFGPYEYLFRGWYHIFSNHELTEEEKRKYEDEALSAEAEEERVLTSPSEIEARIQELEKNIEDVRLEIEKINQSIDILKEGVPQILWNEFRAAVRSMNDSSVTVGESEGSVMNEFKAKVDEINRLHGEVEFALASLQAKKEDR